MVHFVGNELRKETYKRRIKKANQNQTFQLYLTFSRSSMFMMSFEKVFMSIIFLEKY